MTLFASEARMAKIEPFIIAHKILSENSAAFDAAIKSAMDAGNSYPSSAAQAYRSIIHGDAALDLTKPNNILGKEYSKCCPFKRATPFALIRFKGSLQDTMKQSCPKTLLPAQRGYVRPSMNTGNYILFPVIFLKRQ